MVANAEGENPIVAPNTWVEVKGLNLAKAGDSRIWQGSDFVSGQLPTKLDGVSVTVNAKSAYVYYIGPVQVNILTPPDAMQGPVVVQVTKNGAASQPFSVQAQPLSPSFVVFDGGPYVAGVHSNGSLIGPSSLCPGSTAPAKPGETVNALRQRFRRHTVGGLAATVQFAGLAAPGEFQSAPPNCASVAWIPLTTSSTLRDQRRFHSVTQPRSALSPATGTWQTVFKTTLRSRSSGFQTAP